MVQKMLQEMGHACEVAEDAFEAPARIADEQFDLVISDQQRSAYLKNRSTYEGQAFDPTSQGSKGEAAADLRDETANILEQTIHAFTSALTQTELSQTVRKSRETSDGIIDSTHPDRRR